MHTNRSFISQQRHQLSKRRHCLDGMGFFNQLTSDELFDKVESLLPIHRERLFPPTETLSLFLAQAISDDRSCQNAVNQSAVTRVLGGLPRCSTSTGGYCKARQRLPVAMVSDLTRFTAQRIDQRVADRWRWQGRPVRLVDGTTVTLPDTPANQERYPQPGSQKPGLGLPIGRLVGITCLSSGAVLDATMGPVKGKGNDEQSLLRRLLNTFKTNDIVLADAFYATYFLIAELQRRGVDAVFEQNGARQRSTDFRLGKKLGSKDHLIIIHRPQYPPPWMTLDTFQEMPHTLTVRELKVKGKILITTLCCPHYAPRSALGDLYKSRWNVELDIRHIKTTMNMQTLSCRSPNMAEKEIWIYLLAYNLIRLIMIQSALLSDVIPRRLSFKHTVQLWLAYRQQTAAPYIEIDHSSFLLVLVSQQRVGNRPGRVEPRAMKRRPKACPLLLKPRAVAIAEILNKRQNGLK